MGKSTISMVIFNSLLYVYQAGYLLFIFHGIFHKNISWHPTRRPAFFQHIMCHWSPAQRQESIKLVMVFDENALNIIKPSIILWFHCHLQSQEKHEESVVEAISWVCHLNFTMVWDGSIMSIQFDGHKKVDRKTLWWTYLKYYGKIHHAHGKIFTFSTGPWLLCRKLLLFVYQAQ